MRKDTANFIQSAEYDLETAKYKMSKRKIKKIIEKVEKKLGRGKF